MWVAWLGFKLQATGDYGKDFAPSMNALLAGHFGPFFGQLPYDGAGGSVLLRAPGALLGKVLVGSQLAIFRFGALTCVLALGALGLWLARGMRRDGRAVVVRAAVVGLCVLTPAILDAVFFGHPEEALGAALCVGAVLLAGDSRSTAAGVALGLAIINKPWGVLAIVPALLAAPRGRVRLAGVAGAVAGAWFASAYLVAPSEFTHSFSALPLVAHPEDLWWPLAHLHAAPGVTPAYFAPGFVVHHARELAVALIVPLSLPLARRQDRTVGDCLALLALLLLVRCVLDPSDHIYYHVPFVIALLAWEARTRGAPVISLLAAVALWSVFHTVSGIASLNLQFASYLVVTVPVAAAIVRPAFGLRPRVSSPVDDRHRGSRPISGGLASSA